MKKLIPLLFLALPAFAQGPFPTPACKTVTVYPTMYYGWENYGQGWQPLTVSKDCLGYVHITGGLKNGTTSFAFNLPPGFEPGYNLIFPAWSGGEYERSFASVHVSSGGHVDLSGYNGNLFFSVSGISFKAAE